MGQSSSLPTSTIPRPFSIQTNSNGTPFPLYTPNTTLFGKIRPTIDELPYNNEEDDNMIAKAAGGSRKKSVSRKSSIKKMKLKRKSSLKRLKLKRKSSLRRLKSKH